jgi:hypothetical protein
MLGDVGVQRRVGFHDISSSVLVGWVLVGDVVERRVLVILAVVRGDVKAR